MNHFHFVGSEHAYMAYMAFGRNNLWLFSIRVYFTWLLKCVLFIFFSSAFFFMHSISSRLVLLALCTFRWQFGFGALKHQETLKTREILHWCGTKKGFVVHTTRAYNAQMNFSQKEKTCQKWEGKPMAFWKFFLKGIVGIKRAFCSISMYYSK